MNFYIIKYNNMNIFTQDDNDFSKSFYEYLEDSYNKHIQEKKLKEKNNKIIKENIQNLEKCIKQNLKNDNTIPFDKTFVCEGFKKLKLNNNDETNNKLDDNLAQFYNPMEKIKLYPFPINQNDITFQPNYLGKTHCGDYIFNSNIIPKNKFAFLNENCNLLVVRMSNTNSEISDNTEKMHFPIYWH